MQVMVCVCWGGDGGSAQGTTHGPRELWEEDGRRGGGGEPGGVASAGAGSQDSNLRLRTKGHGRP